MARTHSHRRRSRASQRATARTEVSPALLLVGSFLIGAALDWIRHQTYSFAWSWQTETGIILVAAWLSVTLLARWPQFEIQIMRATGLLLLALLLGSLVLHMLLAHP